MVECMKRQRNRRRGMKEKDEEEKENEKQTEHIYIQRTDYRNIGLYGTF